MLWALALVATVLAPNPLPPRQALVLAGASLLLALASRPPAALLAVLAAPSLLVALGVSGSLGPGPSLVPLLGAVLLAALIPLAAWPGDGQALRRVLLGLGGVLAARAWLTAPELPGAPDLAAPLVLGAVAVAGAAGVQRPGRGQALLLASVALVHALRGLPAWLEPPQSAAGVARAARLEVIDRHHDALAARPALGLLAVRARPRDHALALALLPAMGPERVLAVGWQPAQADLSLPERLAVARGLETQGRGGEALRLLWAARAQPEAAWTYALLARVQGEAQAAEQVLAQARPPGDVPLVPGALETGWAFLTEGQRVLEVHAARPVQELVLRGRGEGPPPAPRLAVRVDGGDQAVVELGPDPGEVVLPVALPAGPHRLVLRFTNDATGPQGDRNVWVEQVELR